MRVWSIRTGLVKPNRAMLSAICCTCLRECLRALVSQGRKDLVREDEGHSLHISKESTPNGLWLLLTRIRIVNQGRSKTISYNFMGWAFMLT